VPYDLNQSVRKNAGGERTGWKKNVQAEDGKEKNHLLHKKNGKGSQALLQLREG